MTDAPQKELLFATIAQMCVHHHTGAHFWQLPPMPCSVFYGCHSSSFRITKHTAPRFPSRCVCACRLLCNPPRKIVWRVWHLIEKRNYTAKDMWHTAATSIQSTHTLKQKDKYKNKNQTNGNKWTKVKKRHTRTWRHSIYMASVTVANSKSMLMQSLLCRRAHNGSE